MNEHPRVVQVPADLRGRPVSAAETILHNPWSMNCGRRVDGEPYRDGETCPICQPAAPSESSASPDLPEVTDAAILEAIHGSSASPEPRRGCQDCEHSHLRHRSLAKCIEPNCDCQWYRPPASSRHSDGEALPLDSDECGVVIDGLILLIADAKRRKGINSESTSDVRVYMAEDLIRRLNAYAMHAAWSGPAAARPAPPGGLVEDGTTSPSQTVGVPTVTGDGAAEREGQQVGVCEFCTRNVVVVHQEASDHLASLERRSPTGACAFCGAVEREALIEQIAAHVEAIPHDKGDAKKPWRMDYATGYNSALAVVAQEIRHAFATTGDDR